MVRIHSARVELGNGENAFETVGYFVQRVAQACGEFVGPWRNVADAA